MDKTFALLLTAFCGGLVAAQAPINGRLGQAAGTFPAAACSFFVGLVVLVVISLVVGDSLGGLMRTDLPWYYFIGGLLGAAYIASIVVTVHYLGAGGVAAATIAGQLTAAVALDHFGWFGLEQQPVTVSRVAGVALLAAGTYLVVAHP